MTSTLTPPQPGLADGSDTGLSASDNITDLATPTVSGTGAVVGALITLYDSDGTTVLGTATADGTGTYAIVITAPLDDGVHMFTVTAKAAGFDASPPSAALTVTVDTAAPDAPTAPILTPDTDTGASKLDGITADGGTGQPGLMLTGLAEPGSLVQLFNGSSKTPLAHATAGADGTYAITLTGLKDAAYSFTTTATDVAGNVSKPSPASSVTVDTSAPATAAAPMLTPGSDTGILHNDGTTSDTTPVIVGTAEANATVELFDTDGLMIGTAKANASGAYAITVPTSNELVSGSHALTVKALDAAGNASAASDALNIVVDTTATTATSTPETANLIFGSIPFDLHFSEPVSGVNASDFALVTTGTAQGEVASISGSGSDYKVTVDGLGGQGDISLAFAPGATITDLAGNAATLTESDAVTIDQTDMPSYTLVADVGPPTPEEHGTIGLSSGGRLVSFDTQALGNSTPGLGEVYVKDLRTGGLTLVSAPLAGGASDGDSNLSSLSSNGGVIAFYSTATNLVPGGPTDGSDNFYVATLSTVAPAAGQAATVTSLKEIDTGIGGSNPQYFNGPSDLPAPVVSGDGQHVLFRSVAGLTPDSTTVDFSFNLYEENLTDGTLKFINSGFGDGYSLSSDGSLVAYSSYSDSYVLNTMTGVTTELTGYQTISNYGGLIVNVQNPHLSALGNWVTYDVNYGGSSPRTTVYEQNLVTGRTLQIAPATIGTDDDEGQGVNNGGRYVLYTTNTLGLTTAVPSQLYLQDAVTGTNTAITNGTAPVLTSDGNAVAFLDGDPTDEKLYVETLGPDIGVGPIGQQDEVGSTALAQAITNGLTVSGVTDAPDGSSVQIQLSSATTGILQSYVESAAQHITTQGGVWTATIPGSTLTGLPDGTYTVSAIVGAINGASFPSVQSFTIDTAAPAVPDAPKLDTGSDTSAAHDGSLTNTVTPVITGTAEAGATITLYETDFNNAVGQGVADSQGVYTITSGPLNEGLDHLAVTATDVAGNVSAKSAILAITIDSIAPDAPDAPTLAAGSDTGVSAADGITDTATPTITGSDAEAGTTITLYDTDGIAVLGTATVDTRGNYSITPALLSDGAHTLTVTATDRAGNVSSVSAPLNVTIDTEPPLAPTLDDGVGKIAILGQTVDVTGTAEAGATVTLQVDGGNITFGDATVSPDGDYDIDSDLLSPGAHKLTVIATDLAGNASQPSLAANVTITAFQGTPPGVPANTPFIAGFGLDGYLAGATVFGDANGNGVLDPGEASTLTDLSGAFKLYATDVPLGLTGGIDTTTGLAFTGTLEAPESVTIISPISTFYVAYEAATGTDSLSDQTQDAAAAAIGIDPANLRRDDGLGEDDLLGRDPVASAAAGTVGPEIADAKLIDTAVDLAAVIGGAGGSESRAFGAVFTAIAQQAVASGAAFDFDSTTDLSAALVAAADGLSLPDGLVSAAAQAVAAGNMAIDAQSGSTGGSSLLAYVAGAEIVAQGALAQALTAAGQMPTAAASLLAPYSGSALAKEISSAEQAGLSAPQLATGSDTGFRQTDDITSDRTPTLVGTALPGANVVLVLDIGSGSPVIGVGTADATGHYSIQVTALPSNGGLIYATLGSPTAPVTIGSTVNPPASASLSFLDIYIPTKQTLVDGLPYIKEAVEQASGDPTEAPLLVSGFANTNDGALVSIYADGNPVPIGTAFTYGDFGIETSPLSVGSHVLTVTSTAIDGVVYSGTTSFTTTLAAPSSFSGQASANGPIAGAEAYYSTDGSSEEAVPLDDVGSVTDSQGRYTLPGDDNSYGLIRLTGGYDTLTGSSLAPAEAGGTSAEMASGYSYDLLAPEGAGAITPLTTLVAEIPFSGPTVQQANVNAEQKVETGLGLTSGLDLLSLDPLTEAEAGDTAPFLAAAKLLDTATLVAAVRGGFQNAFAEIAQSINTNGTIDLDSAADIDAIIGRSLGGNTDLTAADIQLLSATIAASNAAIDAHAATASSVADLLSYTLAVERVAGGAETTAVQAALNNADNSYQTGYVDSFPGIEAAFSGSNLDAAAAAALTQSTQVTSFVSDGPSSTGAASADYTITFSQPVTGVSAGDFTAVAGSGLVGAHVTGVTPVQGSGGSTYDVSVATGIGQGTLAVAFSGTGILDAEGLPLTSGGFESTLIPSENFLSYSSGVALGDFNGDGRPDIIVSGPQNAGTLELFLNQGNGVFATQGTIAGERGAAAVAVGDFNGDGKLDAVTADAGGNLGNNNAVSIVLGNGDGTFKAPDAVASEADPTAIAVGDFNHDGKLDIVTVDHNLDASTGAVTSSSLGILLGNGDGTFTPAPTIAGGGGGVAVADVNGDGNLDLVTTSGIGGDTVSIFYGNGDGTFTADPQGNVTTGNGPIGVAVGDVNGDGIPDIVTANATDHSVSVLLGSTTGAFTALSPIVFPADVNGDRLSPASIAIADTNNDGIPDIVVSGYGTPINTLVLIGRGDGTFTTGFTASAAGNESSQALAVGDLDGDGRADIVLTDAAGAASDAIDVLTNIAQPVLSSTSAPVTIARSAVAAPVITELAGGGTLTQTGSTYTLDLGTLSQGQAEAALQFALSNIAASGADAFDGVFGAPSGSGFTVAGVALPAALSAGQSYAGLTFGADTTALGLHSETLTFAPRDETDTSGRATTLATGDLASDDPVTVAAALPTDVAGELPALTLIVEDDVVASTGTAGAAVLGAPTSVALPNVRVGSADSEAITLSNTATPPADALDVAASASGDAVVSGAVSGLAAGASDGTAIAVGLDTSAAGARGGTVTLDPVSDADPAVALAPAQVAVSGAVFRAASAIVSLVKTIFHVGDTGLATLSVGDSDPADGSSESLIASLTGTTGGFGVATGGPTADIAAGAADTSSLALSFSTATAGTLTGTATLGLTSDGGTGPGSIDGLGTLALPAETTPVAVTVEAYAQAALSETFLGVTRTQDGAHETLDLGTLAQNTGPATIALSALNEAAGPADLLAGGFAATGSAAFTTALSSVSGLAAGQSASAGTVSLSTAAPGAFSETLTFSATGSNASGYSGALGPEVLTITGDVAPGVPAPPPSVAITTPGGTTGTASQTVVGTGEAGTALALFDNGGVVPVASTEVDADGHWSAALTLASGDNVLSATDTDADGAVGTSNTIDLALAPIPPAPTLPAPTPSAPPSPGSMAPTPPPAPSGPIAVTVDPHVRFTTPRHAILHGTVSDPFGTASVELYANGGALDIGAASVNANGTWTIDDVTGVRDQHGIFAVAGDAAGDSGTAAAGYDLNTGLHSGIADQPYTATQDDFSTDGTYLGSTFFEPRGRVLFSDTYAALSDGDGAFIYSGGSFFNGRGYASFTDIYTPDGQIAVDILDDTDGSHVITGEQDGQRLRSHASDTLTGGGASERFVFRPGFGTDTVTDFRVAGPGHDILALPSSRFSSLAQVLAATTMTQGHAVIQLDPRDSIVLDTITAAELKAHPKDIVFHP